MTYILWRDVPLFLLYWLPSSICIFVFLIIPVVWIVGYAIRLCCKSYSMKYDWCVGKVFNMFSPRRAHAVARFIFRKILERGEEDSADNPQTILFGYIVTDAFIYQFLGLFLYINFYAFVVFWEAFFIHDSYSCNVHESDLDCFSKRTRIRINCYNATVKQQAHVICFKFSYNFALGLGEAGIVYLLSSIIIPSMVWFLLCLSRGKSGSVKRRGCTCFIQVFLFIISIVLMWVVSYTHFNNRSNFLYFFLLFMIVVIVNSVLWIKFEKKRQSKTENNNVRKNIIHA